MFEVSDNLDGTIDKAALPSWLSIVKTICGLGAFIIGAGILQGSLEVGFGKAYQNASWLFLLGGVLLILYMAVYFHGKKIENKVYKEDKAEEKLNILDDTVNKTMESMGVPDDATDTDIITFNYKDKNGQPVACEIGVVISKYLLEVYKLYSKDDMLCLADAESVYGFSLSEIKAIKTINKKIPTFPWNKDEGPKEGIYKKYKMVVNSFGCVYFKPYYILEIEHKGEEYGLYFPCYELEHFEKLTGIKAEEIKK